MQTTLRKTDIRQATEQRTGNAEAKRLDILAQCNRSEGRCRKEMSGSKINEIIGDLIGTGELELLSFGKGGRLCRTTKRGKESLAAKRTILCDTVFVRNEDNTNASRNDATQFVAQSEKATKTLGKVFNGDYDILDAASAKKLKITEASVKALIATLKPKSGKKAKPVA